jgi:hypothetical protein
MFNIISEITGNGYFFMYNSTELLRVNPTEITASKVINANAGVNAGSATIQTTGLVSGGTGTFSGLITASSGVKIPTGLQLFLSSDGNNYIINNSTIVKIQYVTFGTGKSHDFYVVDGSKFNISQTGTNVYGTETVSGLLTANGGAYFGQNDTNLIISRETGGQSRLRMRIQEYFNGTTPYFLEINPLGGYVFINQTVDPAYNGTLPSGYSANSIVSNDIIDLGKLYVGGTTTTTGLLTANGGITVPSGQTLTIASGAGLSVGSFTPIVLHSSLNITSSQTITLPSAGFYKVFVYPATNGKNDSAYMFSMDVMGDVGYRNAVTSNYSGSYYSINTNSLTGAKFNIYIPSIPAFTNATISYIKFW